MAFNYPDNLESGNLIVMVDPFMKLDEIDEENNTLDIAGELIESTLVNRIVLSSSKEEVSITIPTEILSGNLVTAMLYSIDGRIVAQESAEVRSGVSLSIGLQGGNGYFSSGCYALLLRDGDNLIIRRKLLVIEQ